MAGRRKGRFQSEPNLCVTVIRLQTFRFTERVDLPNVICDYRATDTCNPGNPPLPCCQRPEVVGGSGVMIVSSLLLMTAVNIATLLLL